MANFYRNIVVKGAEPRQLLRVLSLQRIDSYVWHSEPGLTIVHVEYMDDLTAQVLSHRMNCAALSVWNAGDSILECHLYLLGELVYQYRNPPEPDSGRQPGSDPRKLCDTFDVPLALDAVITVLQSDYSCQTLRHRDLASVLAIPFSPIGFDDIDRRDIPPGFVPAELLARTPASEENWDRVAGQQIAGSSEPDESFLPQREDLYKMTVRTALALATRSARRANQHFLAGGAKKSTRRFRDAVENAIQLAEEFVKGASSAREFLARASIAVHRVGEFADDVRYGENKTEQLPGVSDLPGSAHSALLAAIQAVYMTLSSESEQRIAARETVIGWCYEAIRLGVTTRRDWAVGLSRGDAVSNDLGDPVDCGENGPFGAVQ